MAIKHWVVGASLAFLVSIALQGCGGGATTTTTAKPASPTTTAAPTPGPTTTVATTTVTTSTVTTTSTTTCIKETSKKMPDKRTAPKDGATIATKLNQDYMGFDPSNAQSPSGVLLSIANQPEFDNNMFCSHYMCTGCVNGHTADCRLSAAMYNNKMLKNGKKIATFPGRGVGYVFDERAIKDFGKCATVYDGATNQAYNHGCGIGGGQKCGEKGCPFANICASGKTCTKNDPEVKNHVCKPYGPANPPSKGSEGICMFELPKLDLASPSDTNHIHEMLKFRAEHQSCTEDGVKGACVSQWNEIVLDEMLVVPAVIEDPATVITAFVYIKGSGDSENGAKAMRDQFCKQYNVQNIPIIAVDHNADVDTTGPFSFEGGAVEQIV